MKHVFIFLCMSFAFSSCVAREGDLMKRIKFANKDEATKLMNVDDVYTRGFGLFDVQSKTQRKDGSLAIWKQASSKTFSAWSEKEQERLLTRLSFLDSILAGQNFILNLPSEIVFIKSNMEHEGGAEGYTRGHCIVLNDDVSESDDANLNAILLHELFHVLSRHDASLRKDLYKLIGFTVCNDIELPQQLMDIKISNPDAPYKDSYITVKVNGESRDCMMLLYADRPYDKGSFFSYMTIGLVLLSGDEKKAVAKNNGMPILYTLDKVENFFEQIGLNTNYIIDPEEAMADNFVFAVLNDASKPSQNLLDQIRQRLKRN